MASENKKLINNELSQKYTVNPDGTSVDNAVCQRKNGNKKNKVKKGFYYSFLTIVLLFCLLQVGFGVILNISKTISYKTKINTLEKVRDEAEARNLDLKDDIKQFSTTGSLEGIARNNLKMAGEDEVLVIINNEPKETANTKKKK